MQILMMTLIAIAALALLVLLTGALLPEKHVATVACYLNTRPENVWAVITDFEAQPKWRTTLKRVERMPNHEGNEVWREVESRSRQLSYETMQARPPHLLTRRIVDEGLPFGGTWTFEITPEGRGSQVRITEHGEVRNVLFRFISRFVIGHTATMELYVNNLQEALKSQYGPVVLGR